MIIKTSKKIGKKILNKPKSSKTARLATIVSFILISALALNLLQTFEPTNIDSNSNRSASITKSNN